MSSAASASPSQGTPHSTFISSTSSTSPTSTSGSTNTSDNSHTAIVVSAAVGGGIGLIIIILFLICILKRGHRDEHVEPSAVVRTERTQRPGTTTNKLRKTNRSSTYISARTSIVENADPERIITHVGSRGSLPILDLAGGNVTPFPRDNYDPVDGSMLHFAGPSSPTVPVSVGASRMPSSGSLPRGAYLPPSHSYGPGTVGWRGSMVSSASADKEREVHSGQSVGPGLATQPEVAEGGREVVVHEDAGRAPVEAPPVEIPPAYESIRHN